MSDQPLPEAEALGGIAIIRRHGECRRWNGIQYRLGMSSKNVGARQLSMNVATIPPGGTAAAHIHADFEVMLYILEGRVRHDYGPSSRATWRTAPEISFSSSREFRTRSTI